MTLTSSKSFLDVESQRNAAFLTAVPTLQRQGTLPGERLPTIILDPMQEQNDTVRPKLPTQMGVEGEIDTINGLLDKVRAKTRRINTNSPRTSQALVNLGITKEECMVKRFEEFGMQAKNEKMSKLLYVYYISYVNDTILQVLKEREKLKKKGRKLSFEDYDKPIIPSSKYFSITDKATKKAPYEFPSYEKKLEKLEIKKFDKIQSIERQAMNYLEEERDYLKQVEAFQKKHEKFGVNRKKILEKRDKDIVQKKEKYANSIKRYKEKVQEEEEEFVQQQSELFMRSTKEFKKSLFAKSTKQIFEHRDKQQRYYEEQKMREERLSQRESNDLFRSTFLMEEYQRKDAQTKSLIEKQKEKRRMWAEHQKQKYERTRENALIVTVEDNSEACHSYAEKMNKIKEDEKKREMMRSSKISVNKKMRDAHLKKIDENLQDIQRYFDDRKEDNDHRIVEKNDRLSQFYFTRRQLWDQKQDLNKYRQHRSQIHFSKVMADHTHKSNVIITKDRLWKEKHAKKVAEKESIRDIGMQNYLNVRAEKDSLKFYLDQMSKIHVKADLVAGKLKRAQTAFNTQNMAQYISNNFNKKPEKEIERQDTDQHH